MISRIDTARITTFFSLETEKPVIVIYGPTASGKTGLSVDIATSYGGEIISADSRQIYRGLDIGTGKITQEEMSEVPHHMIDIITPDKDFSVVEYRNLALPILENIWKRGKIPIICGGTGLYIDSLIYERSFPKIPPDKERRNKLEALAKKE